MNITQLTEKFRVALMREHHSDWSMEVISEAAHICAHQLVHGDRPNRIVPGDTPEKAWQRYKRGGCGVYGSPSAAKIFKRYMALFPHQTKQGD